MLSRPAQPTQSLTGPSNRNVIEQVIIRLQNEIAGGWKMKMIAQELGVSYTWFRRTFAAHTGLSPHQYLLELRLVHARNLLAETGFSVKEIAWRTGFNDERYFSRFFRHRINCSPAQWRDRVRREKIMSRANDRAGQ